MQESNITFKGLALTPYSDVSPDGQLAACIGLESHGGALRPAVLSGTTYTLPEGYTGFTFLFDHTTAEYRHFVFLSEDGKSLYWADVVEGELSLNELGTVESSVIDVKAVGNTLIVLADGGMWYYLWKKGAYKSIGNKPPFCSISFGLRAGSVLVGDTEAGVLISRYGEMVQDWGSAMDIDLYGFFSKLEKYFADGTMPDTVDFQYMYERNESEVEGYDGSVSKFVDMMTAVGAEMIAKEEEEARNFNSFTQSFFLRYAYRMYDGTHYMQSAPIFFPINLSGPVLIPISLSNADAYNKKINVGLKYAKYLLDYNIIGFYNNGTEVDSELLRDWGDIITGIDIFISSPIYSYKPDGHIWGYSDKSDLFGQTISSISSYPSDIIYYRDYVKRMYSDNYKDSLAFTLERLDNEDTFVERVKNTSIFFKVSEFKTVDSILAGYSSGSMVRMPLSLKEDVLKNLELQETLEDDYDSHQYISASFGYVYNERLNIAGIKTKLFDGFPMESMVPYSYLPGGQNKMWSIRTNIEREEAAVSVVNKSNIALYENPIFLYYPYTKVVSFDVYQRSVDSSGIVSSFVSTLNAEVHKMLNGSFYLSPNWGNESYVFAMEPQPSGDPFVPYPNKLYTSEVGNPFFFPLEGRYTVGTGEILGMSSIATALSQGQFGQFPLIIFCSDGNYAMSIDSEGRFSTIHAVQRDVCINPGSITQTDSEVMFATTRGMMVTSGAAAQNVSAALEGVPEDLPAEFESFLHPQGAPALFFSVCKVVYDYSGRRFIFFSEDTAACYILSLEDGSWSTAAFGAIRTVCNRFPYTYIQYQNGHIVRLDDAYRHEGETQKGLIYSRPIKLESFQNKSLHQVVLQGTFSQAQPITLYASRDNITWHRIGKSADGRIGRMYGRSYKYFRFAVETSLSPKENISAIRIMFETKKERHYR